MSEYKVIKMKNGFRYTKDKKFISVKDVPGDILDKLRAEETPAVVEKSCIFCRAFSNLKRTVNLQTVALCEEHFYSTNIGQIAQQLRENQAP